MDRESEYDVKGRAVREEKLDLSLPSSPQYENKTREINKAVSEISLPKTHPMTPDRASFPIVAPQNAPLYTPKRRKDFRDKDIYFAIKWACGILTVAASIVFGIWAPLSYEATISDNETQDSMLSVLSNAKALASTANIIASNALDTASAQHGAIGSLYSTIGLMGQLAVADFCYGQHQTLSVCSSYIQAADGSLGNLIDRLGQRPVSTTATESAGPSVTTIAPDQENGDHRPIPNAAPAPASPAPSDAVASGRSAAAPSETPPVSAAISTSMPRTPTATGPAASRPSRMAPRLPVGAVFGVVFGVVGIGGAGLGFVVWRMRRRRLILLGE